MKKIISASAVIPVILPIVADCHLTLSPAADEKEDHLVASIDSPITGHGTASTEHI